MDVVFRTTFLALGIFLCFGSSQGLSDPGSNQGLSDLHYKLRRAVTLDPSKCVDSPLCNTFNSSVCKEGDVSTIEALCPVKCGLCDCSDRPDVDCASLQPAVCESDIKYTSCPKTCNVCYEENTNAAAYCRDQVTDLTCAELEKDGVCNDTLGRITCPKFCGVCGGSTTTAMPTTMQPTTQAATTATTTAATTTTTATTTTAATTTAAAATTAAATTAAATTAAATTATPSKASDACSNNPCLNGGTCQPKAGGSYSCQCPSGFAGLFCLPAAATSAPTTTTTTTTTKAPTTTTTTTTTTSAPAAQTATACSNNPCLNGGTCVLQAGGNFLCQCPSGFVGTFCLPADAATTPTPVGTQAPSSSCDTSIFDGCEKAEVVFMIEYSRHEANSDRDQNQYIIDHEGDYVKALIDRFLVDSDHVRVGVVVYHDTVAESIHITDFAGDTSGLKNRVSQLTGGRQEGELHPSGEPDLARALEFVKQNSFKGARPGAKKVVIPIIHWVGTSGYNAAQQAAQQLKADCVQIFAQAVARPLGERGDIVKNIATQPYSPYYTFHDRFNDLEEAGKNLHLTCSN